MKSNILSKTLHYTQIYVPDQEIEISSGYTSDLLSDVMGNAQENCALITIQGHKNTVAVASLIGIRTIILCNNRKAPEEMIAAAKEHAIALYSTADTQFTASWKLAHLLEHNGELKRNI
ncbi:MAG: iron-sulfur binding hydrogenase [Spirochaetia bacterium]|nr:iron-sulfur binding hydrogenase [Spirochaetia bacterium]